MYIIQGFLKALPQSGASLMSSSQVEERVSILPLPLSRDHLPSLCDGVVLSEEVCTSHAQLHLGRLCRNSEGHILTALFSSSLAGDEEGMDGRRVEGVGLVSVEEVVVEVLLFVGQVLVERGVGLLACQKCIHPTLRDYLLQHVRFLACVTCTFHVYKSFDGFFFLSPRSKKNFF